MPTKLHVAIIWQVRRVPFPDIFSHIKLSYPPAWRCLQQAQFFTFFTFTTPSCEHPSPLFLPRLASFAPESLNIDGFWVALWPHRWASLSHDLVEDICFLPQPFTRQTQTVHCEAENLAMSVNGCSCWSFYSLLRNHAAMQPNLKHLIKIYQNQLQLICSFWRQE